MNFKKIRKNSDETENNEQNFDSLMHPEEDNYNITSDEKSVVYQKGQYSKETQSTPEREEFNNVMGEKFRLLGRNLPEYSSLGRFNTLEPQEHRDSSERIKVKSAYHTPHRKTNSQNLPKKQAQIKNFPINISSNPQIFPQYFPMHPFFFQPNTSPYIFSPQNQNNNYQCELNRDIDTERDRDRNIEDKPQDEGTKEEELIELKIKVSNLESENAALKKVISEALRDKKRKEGKDESQNIIEELKDKIQKMEISKKQRDERAKNEIEEITNHNNKFKSKIHSLQGQLAKKDEEKEKLLSHLAHLKNELENSNKKISKLEIEKEIIYQDKAILEEKLKKKEKKLQSANDVIKEMKNDYELLNKNYFDLKRQNEKLQNEIQNSKEENYFFQNRKGHEYNQKYSPLHTKVKDYKKKSIYN